MFPVTQGPSQASSMGAYEELNKGKSKGGKGGGGGSGGTGSTSKPKYTPAIVIGPVPKPPYTPNEGLIYIDSNPPPPKKNSSSLESDRAVLNTIDRWNSSKKSAARSYIKADLAKSNPSSGSAAAPNVVLHSGFKSLAVGSGSSPGSGATKELAVYSTGSSNASSCTIS